RVGGKPWERLRLPRQRTEQNGQTEPARARTSQNEPKRAKNRLGNPGYRTPCPPAYRSYATRRIGKLAGSLGRSLDCRAKEPNRTGKPSQNEPKRAKNRLGNPGHRTPCPPADRSYATRLNGKLAGTLGS